MAPIIPLLGLGAIALLVMTSAKDSAAAESTPTASTDALSAALGGGGGVNELNSVLANPDASRSELLAQYNKLQALQGTDTMIDAVLEQLNKRIAASGTSSAASTATTISQVQSSTDPIATTSEGVWSGLSVEQQNKIASILVALGVDPQTGTITPGSATTEAIAVATAYAGELTRLGFPLAGTSLRQWAEKAAKDIPCEIPAALATLPTELACAITRVGEMEKDPVKIRALIGQLQPYTSIPQVQLAITLLEQEAKTLEAQQEAADALRETEAVQKGEAIPEVTEPGMSSTLQQALANAVAKLKEQGASAAPYARQIGNLLKTNGYVTEGEQLIALANQYASAATATTTTTTATTTSGTVNYVATLRYGSRGTNVSNYQSGLNRAGFSVGTVDGIFGAKTLAATKALQTAAGITVDGVAGPQTFAALNARLSGSTSTTSTATLPTVTDVVTTATQAAQTAAQAVQAAPQVAYVSTLRWGSRGDNVKLYQQGLNSAGFSAGTADGIFGSKTYAATKALQTSAGITVDGVAGPQTFAALNAKLATVTISGCVGGDCGCVGADCGCAGCGPRVSGVDGSMDLSTHFELRGSKLYAHGYLHHRTTGPRIFTVVIDLKPLAQKASAVIRSLQEEVSGYDIVGGDAMIGFSLKKAVKKAGRGIKRIAKAKAVKAIAKTSRAIVDPRKSKKLKRVALSVTAAVMPAVGLPALAAHEEANKILDKVSETSKALRTVRKASKSATSAVKKLKGYANRSMRITRTALSKKASAKGLIKKFGSAKVQKAVEKAARLVTKKKIGRVLAKAPGLKKKISQGIVMTRRLNQVAATVKARGGDTAKKLKALNESARAGNEKALKGMRILNIAARRRRRMMARKNPLAAAGEKGILIDAQGRSRHGTFVEKAQGKHPMTLITDEGKRQGFYTAVQPKKRKATTRRTSAR